MKTSLALMAAALLFLSSFLLFFLEPLVGKTLLPTFGGTPAVWNTCLVFFQLALLVGYLLSALILRLKNIFSQLGFVLILFCLPLISERLGLFSSLHGSSNLASPVWWIIINLAKSIGLAFVALSTLPSLIQSWYSRATGAQYPYYLYAASNAGSLFGLLAYPLLAEPLIGLSQQMNLWKWLYLGIIAAFLVCAWLFRSNSEESTAKTDLLSAKSEKITSSEIFYWLLLSALPAALLMAVTSYVLTDLASLPLLWIIPLVIYLITFILAFARFKFLPNITLLRIASFFSLMMFVTFFADANTPLPLIVGCHLILFFALAYLCHVELARRAPKPQKLGIYYCFLAAGGALGGTSMTLLAPLLFNRPLEYPLLVATSLCLLSYIYNQGQKFLSVRVLIPSALLVGSLVINSSIHFSTLAYPVLFAYGFALLACFAFVPNYRKFAVAFSFCVIAATMLPSPFGYVVTAGRNFFGALRVANAGAGIAHIVIHGSTIHGYQALSSKDQCLPSSYYHRTGPIGRFLSTIEAGAERLSVGVVGLGVGSLACYANKNSSWDFYEINPLMVEWAHNENLFTFLKNSQQQDLKIHLGDARLELAKQEAKFDILIVDAFTSDSIPTHLLTTEAISMMRDKISDGGVIVFHLSNRYFNLFPQVRAVAGKLGLAFWRNEDLVMSDPDLKEGKSPSEWAVLAKEESRFDKAMVESGFTAAGASAASWRVWTDDFSSPLLALKRQSLY